MKYKNLFDKWCEGKADEEITYATAFQLLDFVKFLDENDPCAALEAAGEQMASCLNTNRHLSEFTNNEDLFSDDDAEALAAWREVAK